LELLSGGEMLVRALADEGVEHVFGYPGGAVLHIYDALFQQDKINHYLVRHEQAAGHMADAYSRVTGKTVWSSSLQVRCNQYCDSNCNGLYGLNPNGDFVWSGCVTFNW
jgi:TPP-dependent indolepyruvate ferredoxin oxidoreductase alpha subunit